MDIRLRAPEGLWPDSLIKSQCSRLAATHGGQITLTTDVGVALKGCEFVYTNV